MDLQNKTLIEWLDNAPKELYPLHKKTDFHAHYIKLEDYLNENVHKEVTIGANLVNPEMLLNDHGPEHIETVISRASYLVGSTTCQLTPYETYLLLCCIQLHDVGNLFGRYKHEKNAKEIMLAAEGICGRSVIEALKIKNIAEAHGGRTDKGNKDKITPLEPKSNTNDGEIRPQMLAAILRFADELADDKSRSLSTLLIKGKIPKPSEVFHAYAMCLESVMVNHNENAINLTFHVPRNFLEKKFVKEDSKILLLDEIYLRVLKMHYERIYCMRFCKDIIEIDKILVTIEFYDKTLVDVFPKISFELSENGYPDSNSDIFSLCEELTVEDGILNGEYVKSKIK